MLLLVRESSQPHCKASLSLKFHFPLPFAGTVLRSAVRLWPQFEHPHQSDRSRGGHYV